MEHIVHKISEWEKAIEHRPEIEFQEIYLENGGVNVVIGTVMMPTKRKVHGAIGHRPKRVRWNSLGICSNANGSANANLHDFNIVLE